MKRYGSRRIKVTIDEKGIKLSRKTVAKLMQEQGLKAIQPKSFVPKTTDSSHGKRVAENLLLNQEGYPTFRATKPDQVWVSDITQRRPLICPLKVENGGCRPGYLATYTDLYTRKIVGWKVDDNMRESLVREPLEKALFEARN